MNVLGSLSQLYMFFLLVLLFAGTGFALWRFINFLVERRKSKAGIEEKGRNKVENNDRNMKKGGFFMNKNGWFKLAIFSFVGILVSVIVLGFLTTGNAQSANIHQQYQGTHAQGNMYAQTPMGNMQMQGNMSGGMMQNDYTQQQLYQMQQQMNQMWQQMYNANGMGANMQMPQNWMNGMNGYMQMPQNWMNGMNGYMPMPQNGMNNMNGSMQMPQNNMNNMGGMGMMNGMMGMMGGMNNMNNMNNMQQGNMNNMPQGNSQNNSGSMGGMSMM